MFNISAENYLNARFYSIVDKRKLFRIKDRIKHL